MITKLTVRLKNDKIKTRIFIGKGIFQQLIDAVGQSKNVFVIADKKIIELYPGMFSSLPCYTVEANEKEKSMENASKIIEWLAGKGCKRDAVLIAIGGGIAGDLAGFAASIYMRGIKLIHVPTTLLAMIDSSIGGKNAVNLYGDKGKSIKNIAGTFYQPDSVYIDTAFLGSLPDDDYLSGIGEMIKYAVIADKDMFKFMIANKDKLLEREDEIIIKMIVLSVSIKVAIVEADEKEGGLRMLLNAGHTIGHLIESSSNYGVPHGKAVAIGLYLESILSEKMGYAKPGTSRKIKEMLQHFGLPFNYKPNNASQLKNIILKDKKMREDGLSIPLTVSIGKAKIVKKVDPADLVVLFEV